MGSSADVAVAVSTPPSTIESDERAARRLLCGFVLLLFVGLILIGSLMTGPIYHKDEGSYLLNAAAIAGKLNRSLVGGYYSGYSLLIAPVFLAFSDFSRIYHGALIVNAALLTSVPFALYLLLRRLTPEAGPAWHALGAIAASCQVALLTDGPLALSENLLVPLYAWMLVVGSATLANRRLLDAVLCGAIAGYLFLTHPRGATLAFPVLAALTLPSLRSRDLRFSAACMWGAAALVAALHGPLEWLAGKSAGPQPETYSLAHALAKFARPETYGWLAFNALGAFTYIAVASFGIIVFSLRETIATSLSTWRDRAENLHAADAVRIALLLGFVGSILVTAGYLNPPTRADQMIYGRYALPALIPMLALGVVSLRTATRDTPSLFWWSAAITLSCIVLMGLGFRFLPHPPANTWVHVNIIDLYIPFILVGRVDWPTIGFYFALIAFVLYSACVKSGRLAVVLFAAVNLVVAAFITVDATLPANALRARERQAEVALRKFESSTSVPVCIGIAREIDHWHVMDYQNWLYDRIDESAVVDRTRCVRGVIGSMTTNRPSADQYRLISTDLNNPYGLFIRKSVALDAYAASHSLPPSDFPSPLPESDRTAKVEPHIPEANPRLRAGATSIWPVSVTHLGRGSTWPAVFDPSPKFAVRVGARADALDGSGTHVEFRGELPRSLMPGESAMVNLAIGPFTKPGRYSMTIGVLQEGVSWFGEAPAVVVEVY